MKAFLVIFSIFLLVFGASILYYRSGPSGGGGTLPPGPGKGSKNPAASASAGFLANKILSGEVGPEKVDYRKLEIRQDKSGSLKSGESRIFTAVAEDDKGVKLTVAVAWLSANPLLGNLSGTLGSETKFTAVKEGQGKIMAQLESLKAEKEIIVSGGSLAPAGQTLLSTNGQVTVPVRAMEIRIYDPSGARFNVNESRTYTAKVLYANSQEKKVEIDWGLKPADLGSLNKVKGSEVVFTARRSGGGILKAAFEGLSASLYLQVN